jgi:large subunit ribosomal protein L24
MAKFHVKKGDKVRVTAGEHKGEEGTILRMLPEKNKAIVEGVNIIKKHQKPSAENPQGGIKEVEAPIHLSNLMLIDPSNGEPTRVGRKKDDNGKLVRISKKTQEVIK